MFDLINNAIAIGFVIAFLGIGPAVCILGIWIAPSDYIERDWRVG